MHRPWRRLAPIAAVTLALAAPAAALEIDLEYDAPPSTADGGPAVAVTFENARPADAGGDEISRICTVRSLVGIPWELHTDSEHVDTVIPRYVADALRAAGYDARVGADGSLPTVHVVLTEMWCAGHVHYETYAKMTLQLIPAGAAQPSWEDRFEVQEGVTLEWGFKEMAEGFEKVFQTGFGVLAGMFGSAAFRAAVEGAPAAVAVAPAPAPAAAVPTGPSPGDDVAAEIVGLYYVYQGTTPDEAKLAAGVAAARELFREGIGEEALRKAVVRVHQEIPGARSAGFELIVPPYARAHAADLGGGGAAAVVAAPPAASPPAEPVVEAPPAVETDPPPAAVADPEMPDVLPDPEMPDVLLDPDEPEVLAVIEADEELPSYIQPETPTVRAPPRGVPRAARIAMGVGGAAMIGGGMLGGTLIAVAMSNASGYDQHGGIPVIGLIPLVGPVVVYGYWTQYGTYRYVQPYGGPAGLLTAVEVIGAALIVVQAVVPRREEPTALRWAPRDVVIAPAVQPGRAGLQLTGRF